MTGEKRLARRERKWYPCIQFLACFLLKVKGVMVSGCNSDIAYNDRTYHIQTEDMGAGKGYILTLLLQGGVVLCRTKTEYRTSSGNTPDPQAVSRLMEKQHAQMIEDLTSGHLDSVLASSPQSSSPLSDKRLADLVFDYLASQEKSGPDLPSDGRQ